MRHTPKIDVDAFLLPLCSLAQVRTYRPWGPFQMAECNYATLSELDGLESLTYDVLLVRLRECPVICQIATGTGNPDLFGIGVSWRWQFLHTTWYRGR